MNIYAIFGLCFIPVIVFFLIFSILSDVKIRFCLLTSLLGILALIPASLLQYFVLKIPVFNEFTFASVLITAIVFNGLVEETIKMLGFSFVPAKKFSVLQILGLGILFGLTVGSFESVIYVLRKISNFQFSNLSFEIDLERLNGVLKLIIERMFSSQAIHAFCSGLTAVYLWGFKNKKPDILPFIFAVLLHGVYNFFVAFQSGYRYLAVVAILFAAVECRVRYRNFSQE